MDKHSMTWSEVQQVTWESREAFMRRQVQGFVQAILEEEVAEALGPGKWERRKAVDAAPGYRNGYGKPRKLTVGCGTITVRRPRVRDLEQRLESRILPLFARRTVSVDEVLPELYLHGLAEGSYAEIRGRPLPSTTESLMRRHPLRL